MSFIDINAHLATLQAQLKLLPMHSPERAKVLDEYQQLQATRRGAQDAVRGYLSNLTF